jgi:hypothetical protein
MSVSAGVENPLKMGVGKAHGFIESENDMNIE